MVRRLDVACGNGEASTAKAPTPTQALISNIKRPKGDAGGFASHRQDQTCGGEGVKKTVTICCPDKPIAFYQLHVCYITNHQGTTHLWSQRERSQLWSCMKQHHDDKWDILDCHSILPSILQNNRPLSWKDSQLFLCHPKRQINGRSFSKNVL